MKSKKFKKSSLYRPPKQNKIKIENIDIQKMVWFRGVLVTEKMAEYLKYAAEKEGG